jgi:hypothetical protein
MANERQEEPVELDESLFAEEQPETQEPVQEKEDTPKEQEEEQELPNKYKGKTALELIQMHQEAERLAGRQGNELGQLRSIIDDILDERANSGTAKNEPEQEVDFFEDPAKATETIVSKVLSQDPRLKGLEETATQQRQMESARQLAARHPDMQEILQDPGFGEWISKSKVRMKMFQDAHQNFDHEVGSELFDLWKERKRDVQGAVDTAKQERREQTRRASTGSGRSSGETSAPILSRDALVELKMKDPEKYLRLLPEIKKAYRAGRVR